MTAALPPAVRQWQSGGRMLPTRGGRVFVRSSDSKADPGDPTILLLHGFPSSSYDFRGVTQRLGDRAWLTLDFLGFGLSDKPRPHHYSLLEQADIVEAVVADAGGGPVVLVAHDMGTSVATELMARDLAGRLPFELQRAVITNGSVIIERASLRPIQKILRGPLGPLAARLTNRRGFVRGFAALFGRAHPLAEDEARAQWALLTRDDGQRILHLLSGYLNERVQFAARWHGAVARWPKPLAFLWATDDPVATPAVLAGLRELRPRAEVVQLPGIGHYPQIEVPDAFTALTLQLLQLDRPAG